MNQVSSLVAAAAGDARVRAACEAEWAAHQADCSGFVRAVGARLGATVAGNADQITVALAAGSPWQRVTDGVAAAAAAAAGHLVIAGLRGQDQLHPDAHGHVVVVVTGPLNRGKYPPAYWGRLNGVGERDKTINWAWIAEDRDRVTYGVYQL